MSRNHLNHLKHVKHRSTLALCLPLLMLFCISCGSTQTTVLMQQQSSTPIVAAAHQHPAYLKGKTTSLSWITGHDCQQGMQAYQHSAKTNPDVALVGTGWVDPTNGQLLEGNNTCVAGSNSMDSVVQLIHSKGGAAYLTITIDTGDPNAWTQQQAAAYIDAATTHQSYIDAIIHEVMRVGYDGAIMDIESVDGSYPNIQRLFAAYNQRIHMALQAQHKWYGIALVPKTKAVPDTNFGAFENWQLIAPTVDFLVIMAVDQSYYTPGPTVSLDWMNSILAYVLQTIPQALPRIIWEVPLYGATWHWQDTRWVMDNSLLPYQQAQAMVKQANSGTIDSSATDLQDQYSPHITYTDSSGIKRAVWFLSARSLYAILVGFWQELALQPQFGANSLQVAVWWRTTQEPQDFWGLLDTLY